MKITSIDLKTERQWRSATGLDKERFYKSLDGFERSYLTEYGQPLAERLVKNKKGYCIHNEEELLLFTLISLKSGLTYDLLGLMCGMDASNVQRNQDIGVRVLQQTLKLTGDLPKRNFLDLEEFKTYFSDIDTLIMDATEQRIVRPSDLTEQKNHYSGKKSTYPEKHDNFHTH